MLHWLCWCGYVMPQYEWMTAESLLKWNQTVGLGTKNCLFAAAKLFLNRILMLNILLKLVKWHYLETWKYICHESGVLLCWTLSMFLLHGSLMVNMMMTTMMTQLWEKIVLKTFKVAYEWWRGSYDDISLPSKYGMQYFRPASNKRLFQEHFHPNV